MPRKAGGATPHQDTTLRLSKPLHRAIKQHALDLDVPASQLCRDILALWAGYATAPDNPTYSHERLGGELPGIEECFPGYVERIDFFAKASRGEI